MNYKKLLDRLENDTCVADLELYLSGKKRFDRRTVTPEQNTELLTKIIPRFIKEMHNDIENDIKYWRNAPIFRLAYVHCINNRIDLSKIMDLAIEIVNRINKDNKNIAITQRYKEYYKRTVNTEIL
jgi:hypothetical protein